jgi:hypothetical protein
MSDDEKLTSAKEQQRQKRIEILSKYKFQKNDPRINRNGAKKEAAWEIIKCARKVLEEEIDTKRGKMKRIEKLFLELVESKKYESILKLISMVYGLDKLELTGDVLIKWVKIQQPPSETLAGQGEERSAT